MKESFRFGRYAKGFLLVVFAGSGCGGRAKDEVDGPLRESPSPDGGSAGDGDVASGGSVHAAGGSVHAAGGSVHAAGGSAGDGGSPSVAPEPACVLFEEELGECGGTMETCPFSPEVTPCQLHCIGGLGCLTVDDQAETPEQRWGYASCFERCETQYYCEVDEKLVLPEALCDGEDHCSDGADEQDANCGLLGGLFACGELEIPRRQICDGTEDCADGADEATCPGFLCHDGSSIISEALYCNGLPGDCPDGSDESCITR